VQVLLEAAPALGAALEETHVGFLCDKMARMFVPRFLDCLYHLRK